MSEQCKREKCKGFLKCNPDLNGWLKNKDLHLAACESQKLVDRFMICITQNPESAKKFLAVSVLALVAVWIFPTSITMLISGLKLIEESGLLSKSQMQLLVGIGSMIFGFLGLYAVSRVFVRISVIVFGQNNGVKHD